uniref:Crystal protein NT32KD n=1 Tax=Bacillus thuringiensis subsp. dakota TaxID=132268 RepID=Q93FF3_BACUA|nr:crystal protein NT32KD [Bacillus thuringiensis serovar dakota]
MAIENIMDLIEDYAQQWSEQHGGGRSEIRFLDSSFANKAFQVGKDSTTYLEPTEQEMPDIKLDTQVFTNDLTSPQTIQFNMQGEADTWQKWRIQDGAIELGRRRFDVEPLYTSTEIANPLSLFLDDTLTIAGKTPFSVENRDYMVRPRFKITATLMATPKLSTRAFDVKRDITGYIELFRDLASGDRQESLHNVGAIFQRYYSPYIEVDGKTVTLRNRGEYQSLDVSNCYIHLLGESLDIPGLKEEYNIYNLSNGNGQGGIIPNNL